MKYVIKKSYSGPVVSGEHVDFQAGEEFDTFEDFIVKGDMLVCRIDSDFFKKYFSDDYVDLDSDTSIAEEISIATDTLTQLAMTMDSLEAG